MNQTYLETCAGVLVITSDQQTIYMAEFIDNYDLDNNIPFVEVTYFDNHDILLDGTPFQQLVWDEILKIPLGQTRTYTQIAEAIQRPTCYRAVANACGANKIALFIPCHRVVGKGGKIGGYKWGPTRKEKLLVVETSLIS